MSILQDNFYGESKIELGDEEILDNISRTSTTEYEPESQSIEKIGIDRSESYNDDNNSNSNNNNDNNESSIKYYDFKSVSNKLKVVVRPTYLNSNYFQLITETKKEEYKYKKIEVICKVCDNGTILKGPLGISSNFLKHLKAKHPEHYKKYLSEKKNGSLFNRSESTSYESNLNPSTVNRYPLKRGYSNLAIKNKKLGRTGYHRGKKQNFVNCGPLESEELAAVKKIVHTIPIPMTIINIERDKKKNDFDMKILKFLISTQSSLNLLDNHAFQNLFEGTSLQPINKNLIIKKMEILYELICKKINTEISKNHNNNHCIIINIWLYNNIRILKIACTWLDDSFKRQSIALYCKKFSNIHDDKLFHQKVIEIMNEVCAKYNLNNEQVMIMEDNELNLLKIFEKFDITDDIKIVLDNTENLNTEYCNGKILPILENASYSIALIIIVNFNNYIQSNSELTEKYKQTMSKCTQFWDKIKCPDINNEISYNFRISFNYPYKTKWNSLYSAINDILIYKSLLPKICQTHNTSEFTKDEIDYLHEYYTLIKPFIDAINFLQKEENSYYGYLIPTLATIMTKLKKLELKNEFSHFNDDSIKFLKQHLIKRFSDLFKLNSNKNDLIVASVICPTIKIRWLNVMQETAKKFDIKSIHEIITDLIKIHTDRNSNENENILLKEMNQSTNSFFDFDDDEVNFFNIEYYNYLNEHKMDMSVLNNHPTIKKLFLKYNSPLPSSAVIEKLFPFEEIITSAQRYDLSDDYFEKLIFLKLNYNYLKEIDSNQLIYVNDNITQCF